MFRLIFMCTSLKLLASNSKINKNNNIRVLSINLIESSFIECNVPIAPKARKNGNYKYII